MPLDYPIVEHTLPNGLKVVVSPDHTIPVVTVNLWVGVGSRHEEPGHTGFAHLFEHLMFQGSAQVAKGEHFESLLAVGGRLNATTWFDRTNYFETVPTPALELALWLEADRHGHLLAAVNQTNLDNQRDVVKEEKRERYDNAPYGTALIDIYATLFPSGHPYHHPTIGSMDDLDAASLDDVHAFFRRYYGADNTVMALVGDVDPEQALGLVERHFADLRPLGEPPRPPGPQLDPLTEPATLVREDTVPNDRVHLAWRLPVDRARDHDAAALALDAVAGLSMSPATVDLVRQRQSVTHLHSSVLALVDGASIGLVVLDVAPGEDPVAVEDQFCAVLEAFLQAGPGEALLEAVRAQSERSWLSALAAGDERADLIAQSTLLHGDPALVNTRVDSLRGVSADEITQAARRWLQPGSRASVTYRRTEDR